MRPLLGRITCPVLALNGTLDMQVDPESNLGALRSGLSGNPSNTVEAVEGVNHLFQHCRTGMTDEYRGIEETIAPEVLETLVAWFSTSSRERKTESRTARVGCTEGKTKSNRERRSASVCRFRVASSGKKFNCSSL